MSSMPEPSLLLVAIVFGSSVFAAMLAVALLRWGLRPLARRPAGINPPYNQPTHVYEFQHGRLVSTHLDPDVFLKNPEDRSGAWDTLNSILSQVNPQIGGALDALHSTGRGFLITGQAGHDAVCVAGTVDQDVIRITIAHADSHNGAAMVDAEAYDRHQTETEVLRQTADAGPTIAWRETKGERITWANANYFRHLETTQPGADITFWPPNQLFGSDIRPLPEPGQTRRCALSIPDHSEPIWFEISAAPVGDEVLLTAIPAERLVAAEDALREFVQTLSKTFADLPIGLAIFDRRRELVLFNPALVSLSALDAQFLSSRPTLFSFLDQLREKRQMPEPKNYKAWRESIAKLEADAEEGTYHDLWTLPMGQTYRVIGRPHPGGAIAFMFEDISSEVSLTRQFRADLDLYQAAIDQNDAAIAVFSGPGQLVMSNTAYAELWGHDPRELLGILSLTEATQRWQSATIPAPLWGEIRDFAAQRQDRVVWTDETVLPGIGTLFTRVSPLKGGATMLSFEMVHDPDIAFEGIDADRPEGTEPTKAEDTQSGRVLDPLAAERSRS